MSVTECADALMAMLKLSRYAQTTDSRQKLRDRGGFVIFAGVLAIG